MIGRAIVIPGELLEADGIIIRPDIDVVVQAIAEAGEQVRLDPFQSIHIQPDESITDKYPVTIRPEATRSPGVLGIDGQPYIPTVVPGIVRVPDIGVKRNIPLSLEVSAGRKGDRGQIRSRPGPQVKTRRSGRDQGCSSPRDRSP